MLPSGLGKIKKRRQVSPQGARRGRYPQRCRLGAGWPLWRPAARQQRGNRAVLPLQAKRRAAPCLQGVAGLPARAHVGTKPDARVNRARQPAGASGGTSSMPTVTNSPNGPRRIKSPLGLRSFCDEAASHAAIWAAAVIALSRSKAAYRLRRGFAFPLRRRDCRRNAGFPWRRWQGCGQAWRFRMHREHVPKLRAHGRAMRRAAIDMIDRPAPGRRWPLSFWPRLGRRGRGRAVPCLIVP